MNTRPHRAALVTTLLLGALLLAPPTWAASSVYLEDLTTAEVSATLRAGHTTLIIPVGGTEQNGPHMALGKHNTRVQVLSGQIATALGNAVVAPVLAYVPEGNVSPPTEHMRYAGTLSIPDSAFRAVLTGAAQSFRQHGFIHIVLLGDSGNYQKSLQAVADGLNKRWAGSPARVHFMGEYYAATQTTYVDALKARGLSAAQIGTHAGVADTALLMAVAPQMVKPELFTQAASQGKAGGTGGDPRAATAELGQLGVDAIVSQTVAAIRRATTGR